MAQFTAELKRQFLPAISVQFPEEGAELYPFQSVIEADLRRPRPEAVILDVANKDDGNLWAALADLQRLQNPGVAVLLGHEGSPLKGERAILTESPQRTRGQPRLHLDDGPDLVVLPPMPLRRIQPNEHSCSDIFL